MGVIIHTGQDKMSMADVRQMWERLLKVPLDALGLPAPAGACSRHICPSTTGVPGRVGTLALEQNSRAGFIVSGPSV